MLLLYFPTGKDDYFFITFYKSINFLLFLIVFSLSKTLSKKDFFGYYLNNELYYILFDVFYKNDLSIIGLSFNGGL